LDKLEIWLILVAFHVQQRHVAIWVAESQVYSALLMYYLFALDFISGNSLKEELFGIMNVMFVSDRKCRN